MSWDNLFRVYSKQMQEHLTAGRSLPKGVSAESLLENKKKLLLTVQEFHGSKEFETLKESFAEHTKEFAEHYRLSFSRKEKGEKCTPKAQ